MLSLSVLGTKTLTCLSNLIPTAPRTRTRSGDCGGRRALQRKFYQVTRDTDYVTAFPDPGS